MRSSTLEECAEEDDDGADECEDDRDEDEEDDVNAPLSSCPLLSVVFFLPYIDVQEVSHSS